MNGPGYFDTAQFSSFDRVRAWSEYIREFVFDAEIKNFRPSGFEAQAYARKLGGLQVMHLATCEHVLEREPMRIARSPSNSVFVSVILSGEALYYQPQGIRRVANGEVLIYSPDEPYLLAFKSGTTQLFVQFPEDEFKARFTGVEAMTTQHFSVNSDSSHNDSSYRILELSRKLSDASISDSQLDTALDQVLREVCILRETPSTQVHARATAFIRETATDPSITAEMVAKNSHMSLRHLNRIFSLRGDTVSRSLTRERVRIATELLGKGHTQDQAAIFSGFGSASTLRRQLERARAEMGFGPGAEK